MESEQSGNDKEAFLGNLLGCLVYEAIIIALSFEAVRTGLFDLGKLILAVSNSSWPLSSSLVSTGP